MDKNNKNKLLLVITFIFLALSATSGCIDNIESLVAKADGGMDEAELDAVMDTRDSQITNANDAIAIEESAQVNETADGVTILHKCNSCHGLYPMDEFRIKIHKEAFADAELTEAHDLLCAYCHEVEVECAICHALPDHITKRGE